MKSFGLPPELEQRIFNKLQPSIKKSGFKKIAEAVHSLSNHFISKSGVTPWSEEPAQLAYLAYYLPLGVARVQAVLQYAQKYNFLQNIRSYVDFGSGPGTVSLALGSRLYEGLCVERSSEAISLHKSLLSGQEKTEWRKSISEYEIKKNQLLIMSYALNELSQIPSWVYQFDAVMIVEPSTREDFNRLVEVRTQLLEKGWQIIAPCTHALKCPLANGRDWCHDRASFIKPQWWDELESHLPIKNNTITFSYLLAQKNRSSESFHQKKARIVGDPLKEKGKTRQMVCQSDERLFLSWLHKEGDVPVLHRGDLVSLDNVEQKSNELRAKSISIIEK